MVGSETALSKVEAWKHCAPEGFLLPRDSIHDKLVLWDGARLLMSLCLAAEALPL